MKVSVVIPAYNEENYISECLQALKNQIVAADEIIVVDNNSSDNTGKIAKEYGAKVLVEKKQGASFARDTGFNAANGEIIARTDADTSVCPEWIKVAKEIFADKTIMGASGPLRYKGKASFGTEWANTLGYFTINRPFLRNGNFIGPNLFMRREIWGKIKDDVCHDDTVVHEDLDLSIHAAGLGKIVFDRRLAAYTSSRRLRDFKTIFIGYPMRSVRAYHRHWKLLF